MEPEFYDDMADKDREHAINFDKKQQTAEREAKILEKEFAFFQEAINLVHLILRQRNDKGTELNEVKIDNLQDSTAFREEQTLLCEESNKNDGEINRQN